MKIFRSVLFAVLGLATFASCSSDDDDNIIPEGEKSSVQVVLRSTMSDAPATYAAEDESPLNLEHLFINIAEIEFDVADDMEGLLPGGIYTDVELEGPFPIDLLSEKAMNGWTLSTTTVPNGTYEEIEFEFDVFEDTENEDFDKLVGNTIYASGSFDLGEAVIPFIIESDEELEIELEYENTPLVLDGDKSKVFIDLKLNEVAAELMGNILEFADAEMEEDGTILINKDKNSNILDMFEDALEKAFEAIEDAHEEEDN